MSGATISLVDMSSHFRRARGDGHELLLDDPLQSPETARTSSRGVTESFANIFRMTTRGMSEVHPDPAEMEPALPAMSMSANEDTRLHKPRWAGSDSTEPNWWARFRHTWREEFAEFWGSFMILLFGAGVDCQVYLYDGKAGTYLQARLAWAVGVAMAVYVSGGVSGGHCNPTVTIVLAMFRGFPARKIPGYMIAQILGCTLSSLMVYWAYAGSIDRFEGGARTVNGPTATAGLFFTIPYENLSLGGAFYTEFLATAVLIIIVFALADQGNLAPPKGTSPMAMFLAILGIGAALGINTGYAMNGARDTGPRLALWMVGYGLDVWTHDHLYFLWGPWAATIIGGITGAVIYDAFIYTGRDSPFNAPKGGFKHLL